MRRHMGRGIWEGASGRRHLGGGIWEEASERRHLRGLWEELWGGSGKALGGALGALTALASGRRHLGGGIWEKASGRRHLGEASGWRHLGGGIWEKASGRRHLGGGIWEEASTLGFPPQSRRCLLEVLGSLTHTVRVPSDRELRFYLWKRPGTSGSIVEAPVGILILWDHTQQDIRHTIPHTIFCATFDKS